MSKPRFAGVLFSALFLCVSIVRANQQDFIGEWINIDSETGGMTRLNIFTEEDRIKIHAWGKCHPNDCDWGAVNLHRIADSVNDQSFKYGFAIWDHHFAARYVNISKEDDRLVVEVIAIFKDGSGRSNTKQIYQMRRNK